MISIALLSGGSLVPLASASAAGSLPLKIAIPWKGIEVPCSGDYPPSVVCHPHPGGSVAVRGLGLVSQSYVYPVVRGEPESECPDGYHVLAYPARLIVKGKGEIVLAVAAADGCLHGPPSDTVVSPTQAFTITEGSGAYADASGSGVVSRTNVRRPNFGPAAATDTWAGTLVVPNLEFDLTPPAIRGVVAKVVRAPRKATAVRVRYKLTATDNVDGAVPVTCQPRSGSQFKVGRRALVRCSATDTSANTTRASFTVTVRRR